MTSPNYPGPRPLVETRTYAVHPAGPCEDAETLADRLATEQQAHEQTRQALANRVRELEASLSGLVESYEEQREELEQELATSRLVAWAGGIQDATAEIHKALLEAGEDPRAADSMRDRVLALVSSPSTPIVDAAEEALAALEDWDTAWTPAGTDARQTLRRALGLPELPVCQRCKVDMGGHSQGCEENPRNPRTVPLESHETCTRAHAVDDDMHGLPEGSR